MNFFRELNDNPVLKKEFLKYFSTFLVTLIIFMFTLFFASKQEQSFMAEQQEKEKVMEFVGSIKDIKERYKYLLDNYPEPVSVSNIRIAQDNLIDKLKLYNLKIEAVARQGSAVEKSDNEEFTVTANGSYSDILRYLNDLKKEKALIVLKSINLSSIDKSSEIKVIYRYKIYAK